MKVTGINNGGTAIKSGLELLYDIKFC